MCVRREIGIDAYVEGDINGRYAVVTGNARHVSHAGHPVDRLFERYGHGVDAHFGVRTRVGSGYDDRRRYDIGKLGNR